LNVALVFSSREEMILSCAFNFGSGTWVRSLSAILGFVWLRRADPWDGNRHLDLRRCDLHNIIHVVTHRDEKIEEQFATILHFHLHGSTSLESLATSDYQG